jgi:menaquinone-specific isochorismate synthase
MTRMTFDEPTAWLARRDGTVLVGRGPFARHSAPTQDGVAFFVSDFGLACRDPWHVPARWSVIEAEDFARAAGTVTGFSASWQTPEASGFAAVFQEILQAIHRGEFQKTVPVVTECGCSEFPPGPAIAAAMARQRRPLQSYGWITGDYGFAGATPELLFAYEGRNLETMALAGTARSEDRDVFAVDEKEIREHEFVARTLMEKLSRIGEVDRRPRETLNLGPIVHFHSPIRVLLHDDADPAALIRLFHPTPALGPLPRTPDTLARLDEWRTRLGAPAGFGAPFGAWHEGKFEAVVAIRAIWWDGRELRLPAGCGVIEASRLVNEWRELRLKREAVRRFLEG